MTNNTPSVLEQMYEASGLPCALTDGRLNIIWKNSLAEGISGPLSRDNISCVFGERTPGPGIFRFTEDSFIYRFNVLKPDVPDRRDACYVVEQLGSDSIADTLTAPPIMSYMTRLCARIRKSMGLIALSADDIDAAAAVMGPGIGEVTEPLNTINKELMLVMREVSDPEQFYALIGMDCGDSAVSISDEFAASAAEAESSLGRTSVVSRSVEKGIFARINRSAFETIVAGMTAECCGGLYPEKLFFDCKRTGSERAAVTIRCSSLSGRKNAPYFPEREKETGRLYYDSLRELLRRRYGASFTRQELPDGRLCGMEFGVMDAGGSRITLNNYKLLLRPERFCAMRLALAELHLEQRYLPIDVDKCFE